MNSGKCFSSSLCFEFPSLTFLRLESPIGEYICVLDLSSFRVCGYQPRHAVLMGWFQEKTPLPGHNGRSTYKIDLCPRSFVKSSSAHLPLPLPPTLFLLLTKRTPLLKSQKRTAKVLEEIADALNTAGIELQMYHAQAALKLLQDRRDHFRRRTRLCIRGRRFIILRVNMD